MAAFNSGEYLRESIESILNQDYKDFELIIINDCSTDNSQLIIDEYKILDGRIISLNSPINVGRAKARNIGLLVARGEYIAILDSDDIALKHRLQQQFEYMENNGDVFLVGSGAYYIDKDGAVRNVVPAITKTNLIKETLNRKNCILHSTVMYRNAGYRYREKFLYSQDYDLYLRLLTDHKTLKNMSKILIKYRINPKGISWEKATQQKMFAEIAKKFYHQRIEIGKDDYEKFEPNDILQIDWGKTPKKSVLTIEIIANFEINEFKKTRKICRKYFSQYGLINKVLLYYILSFTGKKFIDYLRKTIWSNSKNVEL